MTRHEGDTQSCISGNDTIGKQSQYTDKHVFRLLTTITRAQEKALGKDDQKKIFTTLLDAVLSITDSTFGFMAETASTPEGRPFLKSHALSNIAWNAETRALYDKTLATGFEFHNLNTLFGAALKTGQPVIANDPSHDPRSGGLPDGHPPIDAFLALPVSIDQKMVGLIGLANRPGGYDESLISFLQPLLTTCATIITSYKNEEQRIQAEKELHTSREEWKNIFHSIGDYVLILNPDHTIAQANQAVITKTGLSEEQLVGKKCHELFHGTDHAPADCPLPTMIASRDQVITPMEVQTLDGVFLVSCTPVFDEEGTLEKIIHIATDITPLKKAAMDLAESEKRFKSYFEEAPIGMKIVDSEDRIVQANNALCQLLGYPREILQTKTVSDITYPDDIPIEIEHKHRLQESSDDSFQLEKRYLHADGHIVWGQLTVTRIKNSEGAVLHYLGQLQDITARKNMEHGLRQAVEEAEKERARANAIIAAIGDPITIQDINFRVIYQNEANKKALGDHHGEYCYEAYEHNSEVCEGCALAKSFADGKIHKSERSVTVNNQKMYFEITASPLLDKSGRPIAGIELARDITDSKKREQLLAEQVRLLSLGSDIGIVLTKSRTVSAMLRGCCELLVQHLDAAFARIWTVAESGEHLRLQASAGMYTHINGPHGRIHIDETTKIGTIGSTKMPHITNSVIGDGKISNQEWAIKEGMIAFAGHPLLIEDHLTGVIGMFFRYPLSEVTNQAIASIVDEVAVGIERLRTEEKLRRSNRALAILSKCNETLIKTFSEQELLERICTLIVGPEGYLMAWVGYAEADEAKTIRPMAHAGFDEGYLEEIQVSWHDSETGRGPMGTAIRTGRISIIKDIQSDPDFTLWRAVATQRGYASIIALPLTDSTTTPFGALCIYSSEPNAFSDDEIKLLNEMAGDLSFGINTIRQQEERKKEQKEQQQLQARLRQAQKMEAIGTLAGGIAHDFNNILSAILGYSELLKEEIGEHGTASEDLQQVITAGKRATELVRQILTISRQTKQERQPVKLQYIIKETLKLLRPSISTLIEIKSSIDPECPEVFADPTEIHQVIMNLCTNANHALLEKNAGEHVLEISLIPIELTNESMLSLALDNRSLGRFIKLTVSDTGCGMDENTMTRIFEPYFTTKKKGQGTGLGMALVHGIIQDLGGAITVESAIDQGTIFSIFIPAYQHDIPEDSQIKGKLIEEPCNESILVIDDEEAITQLLQRTLGKLGYRVTAVTSGEDAMRIFKAQPAAFDLIITDMNLPKAMGTDLAQVFLATRPDIPIILCTGFSEKIDLEKAKEIGIRELIYKPVDRKHLCRLMRKLLDENKVEHDK